MNHLIKFKYGKVLDTAKTIAFFLVLVLACLSLLTILPLKTPIKPFIVLSGSMNPTIPQGSIVFVRRGLEGLRAGDVISFIRPDKVSENVTHRISNEVLVNGKIAYKTKGDANNNIDLWTVKKEAVWGKALFNIPLLGYVVSFSKTRLGTILVIVLPLLIIVADETRVIFKEIEKLKVKPDKENISKLKIIIVIALAFSLLMPTSAVFAKFNDQLFVTDNKVNTSWWVLPSVHLNSPNGGETLYQGDTTNITWTAGSSDPSSSTTIDLYYSTDGGTTYPNTIATGEANDGSFAWTAPSLISSTLKVKIVAADTHLLTNSDESDANFTIAQPVVLNEVMWMGSTVASSDEWIELKNLTNNSLDLTGWKIDGAGSGSNSITLSGAIPAHGYFLLSNVPSSSSAINDSIIADQSTSSLSLINSGEQLTLRNSAETVIDQTPSGSWPAGVNSGDKKSMERNDTPGDGTQTGSWHTCSSSDCHSTTYWDIDGNDWGTPKSTNLSSGDPSSADFTPSPTPTPSPAPASTMPQLSLSLSEDHKSVSFTILNTSNFIKLSYELTYDTSAVSQGISGEAALSGQNEFSQNNLTLGTCSSGGTCVYDSGVKNIKLNVKLENQNQQITALEGKL